MPNRIKKLAQKYLQKESKHISVKNSQLTTDLTDQIYYEVNSRDKFEALCRLIDIEPEFYGLIFCNTKVDVDKISNKLTSRGYHADALHGDFSQHNRNRILKQFKNKNIMILVATDVASRGLDVTELTHVVNYSLPQDPESYVHRIGRTGRAGKKGVAITFITPYEYRKLAFIQKIAKTDIQKKKVPGVKQIIELKKNRIINEIEETLKTDIDSVYSSIVDYFEYSGDFKKVVSALLKINYEKELDADNYNEINDTNLNRSMDTSGKTRLFIALGKNNGYTPKKLVDFIQKTVSITNREIDDLVVLDDFSFITVPFEQAENLIYIFKKEAKGRKPVITKAKTKTRKRRFNSGNKRRRYSKRK
jgi:ATP-dependent RNA helicase DeaD